MVFSKDFALGVVQGFATNADASMRTYLAEDRDLSTKLAEKRIDRAESESSRWQQEYTGYKKDLEKMLNQVGGNPDDLQYILDELGYDQGKDTIQKVYTQAEEQGGPSIQDYFKLKQRMGNSVTINQLARYYTTPVNVAKLSSYKDLGGGFTKLFGGEDAFQDAIKRKSSGVDELPGMKTSLDDMPEVSLPEIGLKRYKLGTLADPKQEKIRLQRLGTKALENGNFNLAGEIKTELDSKFTLAELETNKNQEVSVAQKESIKTRFLSYISDQYGLGGAYEQGTGEFRLPETNIAIFEEATETASDLQIAAVKYIQQGVPYEVVIAKLEEAIRKNATHGYIKPTDVNNMFGIGQIGLTGPTDNVGLMDTNLFTQDPLAALDFSYYPQYASITEDIKNVLNDFQATKKTVTDIELAKELLQQLQVSDVDILVMLDKLGVK